MNVRKNEIMEEIWKEIKDYPYYRVSNLGRIKRLAYDKIDSLGRHIHKSELIMKPVDNGTGYFQVKIAKNIFASKIDGKDNRDCKYVHRLVAEAFIPNPNNLEDVNHKDHNRANNHVDNLEWLSGVDNQHEMFDFYGIDWRLKKYCSNCGKEIWKKSATNLCLICYNKKYRYGNKNFGKRYTTSNKRITVDRDVLKQQIRNQSFLSLGKIYGVSDNAIRKWCKNLNLPYKSTEIKKYTDEEWELI